MAKHERIVPLRGALLRRDVTTGSSRPSRAARIAATGTPRARSEQVSLTATLGEVADKVVELIDAGVERDTPVSITGAGAGAGVNITPA